LCRALPRSEGRDVTMVEWQPTSRFCFVCGRENPVGLKVRWVNDRDAGVVRGAVTVPEHFNGYPGVVHGGIVAALLDETAGRTVLMGGAFDDLMVTLKLEVTYRRPTPTATPLTVIGRLLRRSGSRAEAEAELCLADGSVTAKGKVILAQPPDAMSSLWEPERPFWKVDQE
jgi:acyl-coenzyme A thioesterase PaaI-like protein